MKKVLAVVIAVAFIGIGAVSSDAQIPNVQIYFDEALTQTQAECQGVGTPTYLYVVFQNFGTWISTVEFGVDWGVNGAALFYGGDVHIPGALFIGQSWQPGPGIDGVTITYPAQQNGFFPFVGMYIKAFWNCDACDPGGANLQIIRVVPHETTAGLYGIEWQTLRIIDAVGLDAAACPGDVSTEEATWGKVKALYN
jgi:hypothetical protein